MYPISVLETLNMQKFKRNPLADDAVQPADVHDVSPSVYGYDMGESGRGSDGERTLYVYMLNNFIQRAA